MSSGKVKENAGPFKNVFALIVVFSAISVAAAGLAITSVQLDDTQMWVLIGFLVAFPFFGVLIFSYLAVRHAKKLVASNQNQTLDWKILTAEEQKRSLNGEVDELAQVMKVPKEQLSDLRSAYIVAQDLAIRKIQQESKVPLMRFVRFGDSGFDAAYVDKDLLTCIETTFVVSPDLNQEKVNTILKKASVAKAAINAPRGGQRMRLLLVLITQLDSDGEAKLKASLVSKFSSTPVDVDIRLLDFQRLQRDYSEY